MHARTHGTGAAYGGGELENGARMHGRPRQP
jgi:hypothetical protein